LILISTDADGNAETPASELGSGGAPEDLEADLDLP